MGRNSALRLAENGADVIIYFFNTLNLHLGTGEEAIIAGVVSHLGNHDAMALDHRGTVRRAIVRARPVRDRSSYARGVCT